MLNKKVDFPYVTSDLSEFKERSLKDVYSFYAGKVQVYQLIFFLFGVIFLGLDWMLLSQRENWIYHHLYLNTEMVKILIITFTFLLSLMGFSLGISLKPEREALRQLERKALLRLKRKGKLRNLKHKVHEKRVETTRLLNEINKAKSLSFAKKIDLINQALLEFKEEVNYL